MEDDRHPNLRDPNWGEEQCWKCWLLIIIAPIIIVWLLS